RTGLRVSDRRQQAQQPHGDEDVLRFGATVVVAAKCDVDSGAMEVEDGRDAALELEVADRIVNDARARLRDLSNFTRSEPDAVHDAELLGQEASARQRIEERRTGGLPPRRGRLNARLIDVSEDGKMVRARQRGDALKKLLRTALRRRRRQGPGLPWRRTQTEPLHLGGNEVELVFGLPI